MSTIMDCDNGVKVDGKNEDDHIVGVPLLPFHVRELRASGLSDETIKAAGMFSETDVTVLENILNRKYPRTMGPALVFPFYDEKGNVILRRVKPYRPQKRKNKPIKYLQPSGVPIHIYFPPGLRERITETSTEVLITEGEKKALKGTQEGFLTIGLTGVDCWHAKKSIALHPELAAIKWQGRPTYIVFDSDAADNENVKTNESLLAAALQTHGAKVKVVRLPGGPDGEKVGLDDYLVARGNDLRKLLDTGEEPEAPDPGSCKQQASDIVFEDEAGIILQFEKKNDMPLLWCWNDSFWRWRGGRYVELSENEVHSKVTKHLNFSFYKVTRSAVLNVVAQLKAQSFLSDRTKPPTWLSPADGREKWDTKDLLVTKNAVIHLPTLLEGGSYCIAPTPSLFTTSALDFDFLDRADCPKPELWEVFLESLWPNDPEAIEALQMWFGYCLTADTSQHKILMLVGPTRSGKGTIARVLQHLVGMENTASPTLSSLAGNFGLWPLIGKTLAVIADARLSGRSDTAQITERILSISGEDMQTIDRKMQKPVTITLPTRLMLVSNELPRLNDASGALAGRMILLQMTKSWFGSEDTELTGKLLNELPGILWWAIRGWQRLHREGRLLQPASGQEALGELRDISSPVGAFVRECCVVGPQYEVQRAVLYSSYCEWAKQHGKAHTADEAGFGRDIRAVVPAIATRKHRLDGQETRFYGGVGLAAENF